MTVQSHSWAYIPRKAWPQNTHTPVFTAALFTTDKTWEQPTCLSTRMDKEDVAHKHKGILLSH